MVVLDRRLKINVKFFLEGLELLKKINLVWFIYNGKVGMLNEMGVGIIV